MLQGDSSSGGVVNGVELVLHGVQEEPWIMQKVGRRQYDEEAVRAFKVKTITSSGNNKSRQNPRPSMKLVQEYPGISV